MSALFDFFGRFGAAALLLVVGLAVFVVSITARLYVEERTRNVWLGWGACLAVFLAMMLIFGTSIEALHRAGCRGLKSYEACAEGDR